MADDLTQFSCIFDCGSAESAELVDETRGELAAGRSCHSGRNAITRTFLCLCSGHLSPETHAWLDAQLADDLLRAPENEYAAMIAGGKTCFGWLVYAPEDVAEGLPEDLTTVLLTTRAHGADYALCDCDAPPHPDLPIRHPDQLD